MLLHLRAPLVDCSPQRLSIWEGLAVNPAGLGFSFLKAWPLSLLESFLSGWYRHALLSCIPQRPLIILQIHDFPDEAKFLSEDDRRRVLRRLKLDQQSSAEHEEFKLDYLWASLKDWKTYTGMIIYMGCDGALYAVWFSQPFHSCISILSPVCRDLN